MSVNADGYIQDPTKYLSDKPGDFSALGKLAKIPDLDKKVEMNPPLPLSKRAPWMSELKSDKYSQPATAKNKLPNNPGFMVVDPLVYKEVYGSTNNSWNPRKTKYGFRFHFNPTGLGESYARPMDIDYMAFIQTLSQMKTPPLTVNSGASFGLELLLARWDDMVLLSNKNYKDLYPAGSITDAQRDAILARGTMADIEYIFRMCNGDPFDTWHGKTSNWGTLLNTACIVSVGDSKGARKMRGVLNNASWVHQQFAPGMVPVYTQLSLSFSRLPDNYSAEAPDAQLAADAVRYATNAIGAGQAAAAVGGPGAVGGNNTVVAGGRTKEQILAAYKGNNMYGNNLLESSPPGRCLEISQDVLGWPHAGYNAKEYYNWAVASGTSHPINTDAEWNSIPCGAMILSPDSSDGHAWVSLGGGEGVSSDSGGTGHCDYATARKPHDVWGMDPCVWIPAPVSG